MKAKIQKKVNEAKLNNESFDALNRIAVIESESKFDMWDGILNLTSALNHFNWNLKDNLIYPNFHSLGLSMVDIVNAGYISKYQCFCLIKLSSILYDSKVLYENNLISFSELRDIVARVKKDAYKRFKSIKSSYVKKELKNQKLDSDSLVILQAKLAILENEG